MKTSPHPLTETFYHLNERAVEGAACAGLACSVSGHREPGLWEGAEREESPLYCAGNCYVSPAKVERLPRPRMEVDAPAAIVLERLVEGPCTTLEQYRARGGYTALKKAQSGSPADIIDQLEKSNLRGRGGAGFPAHIKWRAVAGEPGPQKYIVANGDEGDPGGYIDRYIMEEDPFCLIETMTIAGYATGATKGIVYCRREYPWAAEALNRAIAEAQGAGLLGDDVLGSGQGFQVEVFVGKGSYLCGEETSLLNSLEGKRPEVRTRPPYPTQAGLWGKPTLLNNIETFASVPWIINRGGKEYSALGFSKSRGTKVVSLNSLFRRPGLYEVEFGVPLSRIVNELGGGISEGELLGVIVGGPLAGLLPPSALDTPFGFEEMLDAGGAVGHGGVVAVNESTTIPRLLHHFFKFAASESCGKCTPCRVGNRRIERALAGGGKTDREEFENIVSALKLTSLCAHGSGIAEFARSILESYPEEAASCWH